jgi:hypothetical protein
MMRALAAVLGAFIVIVTWWSMLRTLVVSRGSSRVVGAKNRALMGLLRWIATRRRSYVDRDRVLVWGSPLATVTSLVMWLTLFFLGYGLLLYSAADVSLLHALREAGSSLSTLGISSSDHSLRTLLDFIAATTGPITIGLLIGYMPTMYSAYQQREALVTLLVGRSSEPAWAPEILARYAMVDLLDQLDELWSEWEVWAAAVAESHTNFPVLLHMRSSRPLRNWLISLLSVMDAAAMHMSLRPSESEDRMRLMLRQGILTLQDLADMEGIAYDNDPSPDTPTQISETEFVEACARLAEAKYPIERSVREAYPHFRGWRANYESIAYELAARIDAVPAPWSGPRRPPLDTMYPRHLVDRKPSEAGE